MIQNTSLRNVKTYRCLVFPSRSHTDIGVEFQIPAVKNEIGEGYTVYTLDLVESIVSQTLIDGHPLYISSVISSLSTLPGTLSGNLACSQTFATVLLIL